MRDRKRVVVLLVSWSLLVGEPGANTVGAEERIGAGVPLVRGTESVATERDLYLEVRGQTSANRVVQVRAEVTGRVDEIKGIKGKAVAKGDLLCRIAVDSREVDLSEASADLTSAELEYAGVMDLQKRGLQSEINVARTRAALESSRARLKRSELALEKTRIVAPFAGVVNEQPVEVGDYLSVGQVCVALMEIDPIRVVGQVAEKSIGQVNMGDQVRITLITGVDLSGAVSFIGRAADPATRTYPVEVTVNHPPGNIRAGLTAQMQVPLGQKMAHLISPASMVLNDEGLLGVRIVDGQGTVRFRPVSIVSEGPKGIWVNGLPERATLITVGQEEVYDGQAVKVDLSPLVTGSGQGS